MQKVVIYGKGTGGHRSEYYALLHHELSAQGFNVELTDCIARTLTARHVIFSMIDETLSPFVLSAMLSLFSRRRVVGFLFRVGECFKPGFKYKLKNLLFRGLRHLPNVRILTIIPFSVDPRFVEVASGWVHDPQFWDFEVFGEIDAGKVTPLSEEVHRLAEGRILLVALGAQNRSKGFDYLADLWSISSEFRERVLVVAAGKVDEASRASIERLQATGGVVVDRFVSLQELGSLYGVADVVWGAYHPSYDQASGITGRAFQCGIPVILRRGSFMSQFMAALNGSQIDIDFDIPSKDVNTILVVEPASCRYPPPPSTKQEMRRNFRQVIVEALGVMPLTVHSTDTYQQ